MKDKVDELYELATQKFESNGYEVISGSNSKTDYGHSRYFYVNQNNESQENSGLGFQVRVSDHSTGDRRILNGEQFIFDIGDVEVVFNKINYWFHPEEYKNVVAVKNKVVTIEVGENDLLLSDEIISERVAKSGSKRFQIKRTYKNEGVMPTHIESGFKLPFKPNNPDIRFAEGGTMKNQLLAPNGKPTNLTPEQWKLVRTPQFKAWFGDWENDPENASKVVDENGEPLVVYHGTYVENPFYVFDLNKADLGFHFGTYEQAKNRAETKLFFKNRKSIVNSFFLNIQNIYEMSDIGEWEYPPRYIDMFVSDGLISESDAKKNGFYRLFQREDNKQIRDYLLAKYGKSVGFIYNNKYEGVGKSFIVLNPAQIKLADGMNTTFDGSNPDIRFAEGGKTKRTMKRIKRGGITYGKSHAEGGIPVKNQSTGDMLEVEGGEGIVNKRSMASDKMVKLNGKDMTICEAVSQLNQLEGGVQFSCDDVSDRQFIEAMAKGGELERGTRTEKEHIQVLKDLYAKRITPKEASKRIAKDHLKEDTHYYSKLAKMEGKMAQGGEIFDKQTEDYLSELTKKFAKGGEVVADKTETINMKDFEGYADQYNGRKNKFFKANDEYQLLVNEGMDVKNNKDLPQDEKDKLLAELRDKAREAKTKLNEERKDFVDMREVKSPFYAPQLADGGKISKATSEAISNLELGDYKFKVKHSFLPQKGVDVFLKIYQPRQEVEGLINFKIGVRNLPHYGAWLKKIDNIFKYYGIDSDSYSAKVKSVGKSIDVQILVDKKILHFSPKISLEILKAFTNKEYYESILEGKKEETTIPPTEKEEDWNWRFKTEEELREELGGDLHALKEGNVFAISMRYLLGKEIKENVLSVDALFRINHKTYGGINVNTEKEFGIRNPERDNEWSISKWMITDKPLGGEEVPPTEEKKEITEKDVQNEVFRWTEDKVKEKKDINTRKYQTSNIIDWILLNQNGGSMVEFSELIAMAKQSEKVNREMVRLANEGLPVDGFVMQLMYKKVLQLVEDLKSQIMLFVLFESQVKEQLDLLVFHIKYLAELDTFDKDYILHIK
jgi:hypothetical protein